MARLRDLVFVGRSFEGLMSFPSQVRHQAGRQLRLVQMGDEPIDWKPMKSIGPGVSEIRLRDQSGAYRVIYVANLKDAVYVLHCFEKRSQKTSQRDLDLANDRFRQLRRG